MKECIIIFDDDEEILSVCKIILERQNYRVETRICCDNIIKEVKKVKPDAILMDLWIPDIGGENATNLLKNDKATKDIPVILFSANADVEQIFQRSKADGFIKKPFQVANFLHIIEITISRAVKYRVPANLNTMANNDKSKGL